MPRMTITLSDELDHHIRVMAYIKRKPVAEIVRQALEKGFEAEESTPRKLSIIGIGESREPLDASRLDEYLAETWAEDIEESMRG